MAGKVKKYDPQDPNARSQAVIDRQQEMDIAEEKEIARERRAEERRRRERIWERNSRIARESQPTTADIRDKGSRDPDGVKRTTGYDGKNARIWRQKRGMGRYAVHKKDGEYVDPGNGDLFGYGPGVGYDGKPVKGDQDNSPWAPIDTRNKDRKTGEALPFEPGKGPKLSFSDTQTGSSRFTSAFETREFRENWIKERMESQGWVMDDQAIKGTARPYGWTRALEQAQADFRKQANEWRQQRSDFLLGKYREQNAPGAPVGPTRSVESQAQQVQETDNASAEAAGAGPVQRSSTGVSSGVGQTSQPASQPASQPSVIRSADGRVTMEGNFSSGEIADFSRAIGADTSREMKTGTRVNGGRYVRGGQIFFGSDDAFKSYSQSPIRESQARAAVPGETYFGRNRVDPNDPSRRRKYGVI